MKKVSLLNNQVGTLEQINSEYIKQDSIKNIEIDLYKNAYNNIDMQYKKVKKYKAYPIIGSIAAFILGLCL